MATSDNDPKKRAVVEAALDLARAFGLHSFSLVVPDTAPRLYVSMHEGPVDLGSGSMAGGVPGTPELRILVEDLERRAFDARDIGEVQQAVLDFIDGLHRSVPLRN